MTNLIDLVLSDNNVFVWSADDWLKLRKDYRIIGELAGCLPKLPRQDILAGLPMLLAPEEVSLLLEKKFARLIRYSCLQKPPTDSLKETFIKYRNMLFVQQETCLREERKKQVMAMMDKIVEGKKRKMLGVETSKKRARKPLEGNLQEAFKSIEIDRKELLEEEMAKIPKLDESDALVQTPTAYPWSSQDDVEVVEWTYATDIQQQLRYKTFKDLWEQGYYVTNGEKFGGDFLVYPGDPIMFHSQFIIQCKQKEEEISITELIAQCRIGCHVRKTQVYAVLCDYTDTIKYQSFQWAENNVLESR